MINQIINHIEAKSKQDVHLHMHKPHVFQIAVDSG